MSDFEGDNETDVREFCARALSDNAGQDAVIVVTLPAPVAPLEAFLRHAPRAMGVLWHPPQGPAQAGSGACARIDVSGSDRLRQLRSACDQIFARVVRADFPGTQSLPPRIFGGLAFAPGWTGTPWEEFGDGSFTLPRWTYTRVSETEATLALAVRGTDDTGIAGRLAILEELDGILDVLEGGAAAFPGPPDPELIPNDRMRQLPIERWREHIESIRAAIESGAFEKIVAARRGDLELPAPLDDVDVIARLTWQAQTIRFCFRRENSTFLGASPETLFAKHGTELETEALAGTIRSLGSDVPRLTGQSSRLLSSHKDLTEHAFVVREIRESLVPLSENVLTHDKPQIRKVRSILHLNTAISAKLHAKTHATELLAALHPTPAVGGAPTRPATDWIVSHEPAPRGWYTGTVGWIDAVGDSVFAVAIRSGVLTRTHAHVFSGAGIVAESDADAEYAETALKQEPLLRALGVEPNRSIRPAPPAE